MSIYKTLAYVKLCHYAKLFSSEQTNWQDLICEYGGEITRFYNDLL